MNPLALADVRFRAHSGLKSDIARGLKSAKRRRQEHFNQH